jgi:hypothetical protein
MASLGDGIFSQLRNKLRTSKSALGLSTVNQQQASQGDGSHSLTSCGHIPVDYSPAEKTSSHKLSDFHQALHIPGPGTRLQSTSPLDFSRSRRAKLKTPKLQFPDVKSYRTRSAIDPRNPWPESFDPEVQAEQRNSVEIAIALPPEHLEPPPAYSYDPPSPTKQSTARLQQGSYISNRQSICEPSARYSMHLRTTQYYAYNPTAQYHVYDPDGIRKTVQNMPKVVGFKHSTSLPPRDISDAQLVAMRRAQARPPLDYFS